VADFYRDDREAYTEAKSELINRIVEKALKE
jgi:(2Fe-2S) ferredoxin